MKPDFRTGGLLERRGGGLIERGEWVNSAFTVYLIIYSLG